MATLLQIRNRIIDAIQDPSFDKITIDSYINQGINEIANGIVSHTSMNRIPPLPDLFAIATVETSTSLAYVSMPATYQRNLQFVVDSGGREVEIYNSMIEFSSDYPLMNSSGDVQSVVEQGGNLYYQKIPSVAETLTLHYFRKPVEISDDISVPDGIPEFLQLPLLVNYANFKCFELIESDDNIVETQKYKNLFMEALIMLEVSIPTDSVSLFLSA